MPDFGLDRRAAILTGAALVTVGGGARAGDVSFKAIDEVLNGASAHLLREHARYLPKLVAVEAQARTPAPMQPFWRDLYQQTAAQTGDEEAALGSAPADRGAVPDLTGATSADALDAIVAGSRGRRVVILNEAHNASRCRAFAHALARRLRGEGFAGFAAEDFLAKPSTPLTYLVEPAAPITPRAGSYIADPVYAEMVRDLRASGWILLPYEQRRDQQVPGSNRYDGIAVREQAEADNLAGQLAAHPDLRVVVYCGYSHAAKRPIGKNVAWMASRLRAKTGIDPFCIDQSWGAPPLDRGAEAPGLTAALDRFAPSTPISITLGDGTPLQLKSDYKGAFDLTVLHPRPRHIDGRLAWLAAAPDRRRRVVVLPPGLPRGALAQAVPSGELARAENTVPADQYPLAAGAREAVFLLPPGRYHVRVETLAGFRPVGVVTV